MPSLKSISKVILYISILVIYSSCKQEPDPIEPTIDPNLPINLEIQNYRSQPYEINSLKIDDIPNLPDTLTGKIAQSPIKLLNVGDSSFVFLTPDLSPGEVTISFKHRNKSYESRLLILNFTPIELPTEYWQDYQTQIREHVTQGQSFIDSISKWSGFDFSELNSIHQNVLDSLDAIDARFNSLPDNEKQIALQFIEVNGLDMSDILAEISSLRSDMLSREGFRKASTGCEGSYIQEQLWCEAEMFYKTHLKILAKQALITSLGGLIGSFLPAPGIGTLAGLAVGAGIAYYTLKDAYVENSKAGLSISLKKGVNHILDIESKRMATIEFQKGRSKDFTFTLSYRNIQENIDSNSSQDPIKNFILGYREMLVNWKEFFSNDKELPALVPFDSTLILARDIADFSIAIPSNIIATADLEIIDERTLSIKFESILNAGIQTFTAKLLYDDGSYSASIPFGVTLFSDNPCPSLVSADFAMAGRDIILIPRGNGGPYTYSLDGINFTEDSVFSTTDYKPFIYHQSDSRKYITFHIKDGKDCIGLRSIYLDCNSINQSGINIFGLGLTLNVQKSGRTLHLQASGGIPPYTYFIESRSTIYPSYVDSQSIPFFDDLPDNTYKSFVRDDIGCVQVVGSQTIIECGASSPNPQEVSPTIDYATEELVLNATGGTPPFTYKLERANFPLSVYPNQTNSNRFSNIPHGMYSLIANDKYNCRARENNYPIFECSFEDYSQGTFYQIDSVYVADSVRHNCCKPTSIKFGMNIQDIYDLDCYRYYNLANQTSKFVELCINVQYPDSLGNYKPVQNYIQLDEPLGFALDVDYTFVPYPNYVFTSNPVVGEVWVDLSSPSLKYWDWRRSQVPAIFNVFLVESQEVNGSWTHTMISNSVTINVPPPIPL